MVVAALAGVSLPKPYSPLQPTGSISTKFSYHENFETPRENQWDMGFSSFSKKKKRKFKLEDPFLSGAHVVGSYESTKFFLNSSCTSRVIYSWSS